MATVYNSAYDQLSSALAETFREYVDDNVFGSNMVFQKGWEEAERVDPGRFLAVDILTGKNQNATAFGQYDTIPTNPQTIISTATFPWAFYVVSIIVDYQTLKMNRGRNVRVNLLSTQLQTAIASLADICGQDLTGLSKGAATVNAINSLGVLEATDNGTSVNNYGNITRTGTGSFANWAGNVISKLTVGNIGTATNDAPLSLFYQLYNICTQGAQAPTEIYTTKQGIAAYMFALQSQQRFAPMDVANAGFSGVGLFNATMLADDHFINPTNGTSIGCNYYAVNRDHTKFFYFGKRGVDFIDWVDAPGQVAKLSRYVASFQYASSQPRTGGQLLNVNAVGNL